jgi:hypothetical protein
MSKETRLVSVWGRALDANLRYTVRVGQLAASVLQSLFSAVTVAPEPQPNLDPAPVVQHGAPPESLAVVQQPAPASMLLEGTAGSRAIGFFVVENKLARQVSTRVEVGAITGPDGHEIQSVLRFDPGTITLNPGEQVVAKITARISRALTPDARYQGEISIPGIAGARIPIIVRRRPGATSRLKATNDSLRQEKKRSRSQTSEVAKQA